MPWEFDNSKPIYTQIEEEIKKKIISGALKGGDKMQSVRDLAQEAGVNPNTMQKALMEIEKQGLIITERTSGRFVTSDSEKIQRLKDSFFELKIKSLISEFVELGCSKQNLYALIEKHFDGVKNYDK